MTKIWHEAWPAIMFGILMLGTVVYTFGCLLDLTIGQRWEKKLHFYPMLRFTCFCGWRQELMNSRMVPTQCYRFWKIQRHTKTCLVWILNADFNELLPYWAHQYAEDLRKFQETPDTFFSPEYYLQKAKERSQRVREGRDAFDEKGDKPKDNKA
jgi:hypothetical protein